MREWFPDKWQRGARSDSGWLAGGHAEPDASDIGRPLQPMTGPLAKVQPTMMMMMLLGFEVLKNGKRKERRNCLKLLFQRQ